MTLLFALNCVPFVTILIAWVSNTLVQHEGSLTVVDPILQCCLPGHGLVTEPQDIVSWCISER